MDQRVKLNDLEDELAALEYPIAREDVAERCGDVTLALADGEENLGDLIAGSNDDVFESTDGLANEIRSLLPQHAVGEPYQSEGEG